MVLSDASGPWQCTGNHNRDLSLELAAFRVMQKPIQIYIPVAQWTERNLAKVDVRGSNPLRDAN